jgi:hypothetical protein
VRFASGNAQMGISVAGQKNGCVNDCNGRSF